MVSNRELAEALFTALLQSGFRNIRGVIHHQTEGFDQGMPTDLAFRLAARNAIMRFLEATRGPGWWGRREMELSRAVMPITTG